MQTPATAPRIVEIATLGERLQAPSSRFRQRQ
jgi:hypothetical protein